MKLKMGALLVLLIAAGCEDTSVTRLVDGETLIVKGHRVTLHGVDAPSSDATCESEKQAAAFELERLEGLLLAARDVTFQKTGMACLQFMTCDAFVRADGVDVGQTLIDEGLAARKGGEGTLHDWCAGDPPVLAPLVPDEAAPVMKPGDAPPPANPT